MKSFVNGFISHIQVRSGDDDLFINEENTTSTIKALRILNQNKLRTGLLKEDMLPPLTITKKFDKLQLDFLLVILLPVALLSFQFQWIFVLG
jgi:hypothetical protein